MNTRSLNRSRRASAFVFVLLCIGFFDELFFGVWEAALPLIRDDLGLSYRQVGLVLSIPLIVASLIEPLLFILADVWSRKRVVLGGAVGYAFGILIAAVGQSFGLLMGAWTLLAPSSGAFVSVSQGALVDDGTGRQEQQMARWTLAGSLGVVCGPLLLWAAIKTGFGWRAVFGLLAILTVVIGLMASRFGFGHPIDRDELPSSLRDAIRDVWRAFQNKAVLRWLTLIEFADLLMDILLGYLALYMVDVVGVDPGRAALAVAVWTGVGLLGDALLLPLLERVEGLRYLRVSAVLELILFAALLLIPGYVPKLIVLGFLGLFNSGWYAILQAQLYAAIPGRAGITLTLGTLAGLVGSLVPLGIGLVAQQLGLSAAMWLLMAGPIALIIGLLKK